MEQQGIPVTMANLNIHRNREEEMRQERMRYEKVLEEAAAQKAREQNKGKARGVEEEYDNEEIDEEGGECVAYSQRQRFSVPMGALLGKRSDAHYYLRLRFTPLMSTGIGVDFQSYDITSKA
ncbi:hypothetical protein PIB30_065022 [Stylosanthes scabra]|uniref:FACT complex subunit n=1 Tax=Stylosanthes scabra TaxID=79078 RepID=A0ABU6YKS9_9FABA|nr:hypothetical protein [Stylosanthes scabra]